MTRTLRSPRLRQKRRRRTALRLVLFIGIPLLLLTGLIFLLRADFLQAQEIDITSTGVLTREQVLPLAEEKLQGMYLWFIPRRTILFFPAQEIEAALRAEFPRIEEVDVSPKGMRSIAIRIKEREPKALWCGGNECYFLDETGLIYAPAARFSDSVYLEFMNPIEGEPIGSSVLPKDEFEHALAIAEGIRETGLTPASVASLPAHEYEITLVRGERILFSTIESANETIVNLKTVLADPELDLIRPGGLSVSYLDLRYGNKVFYKRKGGDIIEE